MQVPVIKSLCKARGIPRSHTKPELVKRLKEWDKQNTTIKIVPRTPKRPRPEENDTNNRNIQTTSPEGGGRASLETPKKKIKMFNASQNQNQIAKVVKVVDMVKFVRNVGTTKNQTTEVVKVVEDVINDIINVVTKFKPPELAKDDELLKIYDIETKQQTQNLEQNLTSQSVLEQNLKTQNLEQNLAPQNDLEQNLKTKVVEDIIVNVIEIVVKGKVMKNRMIIKKPQQKPKLLTSLSIRVPDACPGPSNHNSALGGQETTENIGRVTPKHGNKDLEPNNKQNPGIT